MARWTRLAPILLVAAALAACGGSTGGNPLAPPAARHDNGLGMGGSATNCPGTDTPPPCDEGSTGSNTNTASSSEDSPLQPPADSTDRSGLGMGGS
jgi:hypothetical protein